MAAPCIAASRSAASGTELSPPQVDAWIMPDLVGASLDEAKDAITLVTDDNPVVRTVSVDATGQGRTGPSDSDRRVCWQSPEAGSWIRSGCLVFFHVAVDEACAELVY